MQPSNQPKQCRELPPFQADNLDSIKQAFKASVPHILGQAWRTQIEQDFAATEVRAGWRDDTFYVFAELTDADIFSRAEKNNDRLWELGDVFEIFLQPEGQKSYYEFHIAPSEHWLQLRFPEVGAVARLRTSGMDDFLIRKPIFKSTTWLQAESKRWFVLAQIPMKSVRENPGQVLNTRWKYSFSRYDYTRGREKPIISSTSAHTIPNFHHVHEWNTLEFVK